MEIIERLFDLQDIKYRDFLTKLIPTVDRDKIIGVRTPVLRKLAKEFSRNPASVDFMNSLPHTYFEENNLHAFFIEALKDYPATISRTENFLPHIDNWATCDSFSPKIFKKHPEEVYDKIREWLKSEHTYTVRFGIVRLMSGYLEEFFRPEMLDLIADIRSKEYYVNMASAWYFSTALTKQYETTLPFFKERKLSPFIHNKALQKAIESDRIGYGTKSYLKTLKI